MYKDYFSLDIMPFNTTPDAEFFFASEQHKEALARLEYAITERKGFVLITGEIGSGKTTVCHSLLRRLSQNIKTALITNTRLTGKELLKMICLEFEIDCKKLTRMELLDKLNNFLINQLSRNNNAVVFIDEAQNLTPRVLEEVRLISNLETDKQKLIQIVLMGQPELSHKLELPELKQLKQRIVTRYHLSPMTFKESEEYIIHRMRIAGADGHRVFTNGAVEKIIDYSGGIPRLINIICDQSLLHAFSTQKGKVNKHIVTEVVDEFIPHIKSPIEKPDRTVSRKVLKKDDSCIKRESSESGFWRRFFWRRKKQLSGEDGIIIEFDSAVLSKIDKFNRKFSRYLIGRPANNRLVVNRKYFDIFKRELKSEGIYIETP